MNSKRIIKISYCESFLPFEEVDDRSTDSKITDKISKIIDGVFVPSKYASIHPTSKVEFKLEISCPSLVDEEPVGHYLSTTIQFFDVEKIDSFPQIKAVLNEVNEVLGDKDELLIGSVTDTEIVESYLSIDSVIANCTVFFKGSKVDFNSFCSTILYEHYAYLEEFLGKITLYFDYWTDETVKEIHDQQVEHLISAHDKLNHG